MQLSRRDALDDDDDDDEALRTVLMQTVYAHCYCCVMSQ